VSSLLQLDDWQQINIDKFWFRRRDINFVEFLTQTINWKFIYTAEAQMLQQVRKWASTEYLKAVSSSKTLLNQANRHPVEIHLPQIDSPSWRFP
jgi:hypothetical protein